MALPFDELRAAEQLRAAAGRIRTELARVIVGQDEVVDQLLIALFAGGHCLFVGVPGLAKTLMIQTLAQTLGLRFRRIQFTPDLMPSDITGSEVLVEDRSTGQRSYRFLPGPLFSQVILADEINRTPPKTQAALLEAMQERQVTAGGQRHELEPPFFVLATQNPIEQEGTYPLPEAQLDRFFFCIRVDYPTEAEELEILQRTTGGPPPLPATVLTGPELLQLMGLVRGIPIAEHVLRYALQLVRATRGGQATAPSVVRDYVSWGAGPRGAQCLVLAAKARALLHGQACVATADVRAVAEPALRHRIITNFRAESEGVRSEEIIGSLLEQIKVG